MKKKLNCLNLGCGTKYHKDWINIDMKANSPDVMSYNLLEGIPFPADYFDVVYHSQVLEHFSKEKAFDFVKECYRVLKKNGIIRIVVPDLENIVDEYKKHLNENLKNPSKESVANYDWIMLELFDQAVRNFSGGEWVKFLQQEKMVNEQYVLERTGYVGRTVRRDFLTGSDKTAVRTIRTLGLRRFIKKSFGYLKQTITKLFLSLNKKYSIGNFRLRGEIHLWFYDRYSLSRILKDVGFTNVKIKNAFESDIQNWDFYELDVKDGLAYDPTSLFIEAQK